jgi:hypothetical protein
VVDGLVAGELVVTEGTQKLRDGAAVRLPEAAGGPARSVAEGTAP